MFYKTLCKLHTVVLLNSLTYGWFNIMNYPFRGFFNLVSRGVSIRFEFWSGSVMKKAVQILARKWAVFFAVLCSLSHGFIKKVYRRGKHGSQMYFRALKEEENNTESLGGIHSGIALAFLTFIVSQENCIHCFEKAMPMLSVYNYFGPDWMSERCLSLLRRVSNWVR